MRIRTLLIIIVFLSFRLPASASENIRILIAEHLKTVTLESSSGLLLEHSPRRPAGTKIIFGSEYAGTKPVRVTTAGSFVRVNGKDYRGAVEIRKDRNGGLLVINDLGIEEYLMGVVAEEIPHDWEFEALKAQAVASRAYALYQKKKAGKKPYHITATVKTQVYGGRSGERENTVRAVRETRGLVLTYEGTVIPAFYHSSCGGRTEDASELWDIDAPYLKGVDCSCQEISKYGAWERRLSIKDIMTALGRLGYRTGEISSVEIGRITSAGRVKDLSIRHRNGTVNLAAEKFRAAVGYGTIPSVFFEAATSAGEVVLSGRGMGHGVGLCQWGAKEMARRGHDFLAILRHYYPGTEVAGL